MFYHSATDTYIQPGQPVSLDGTQYPANWLQLTSPADKEAAGLVEVSTSGTRADERLFFVTEELIGGVRVITNTPKPTEMLAALDASARAEELARVRALREQVLARLAGIAGRAGRKGDATLANACDAASDALLNITTDLPNDLEGTKTTIAMRYYMLRQAAITAAPSLELAFSQVDA
jgi:hypothetical protein